MAERFAELEPRCTGCGAALQTEDTGAPGYIPEKALEREPIICQRCFRIRHYNDASRVAVDQDEFRRMLGHIAGTRSLVVHIVDIFDFEGSLISGLQRYVGDNPVVLVVNKIDLLPKVSNWNRILNWVQRQAREQGLKIAGAVLCSARKNIGFDRVITEVAEQRRGRDVYVVGATNVGKSTLINRMIRDYSDLDTELTTSQYPGTTLDLVKIPLDDGRLMIDTPGIVYKHRLTELVPKNALKHLMPDRPIKPAVYQLNKGQSLFFGGYARFDFIRGDRQSFTCYLSNAIPIHRTKLERADELYRQHKGEMLSPPDREELELLPGWVKYPFHIPGGSRLDVYVSGLGWVKVNGESGAEVMVHAPKGVKVALRHSLI
jgi:hypothetical protein